MNTRDWNGKTYKAMIEDRYKLEGKIIEDRGLYYLLHNTNEWPSSRGFILEKEGAKGYAYCWCIGDGSAMELNDDSITSLSIDGEDVEDMYKYLGEVNSLAVNEYKGYYIFGCGAVSVKKEVLEEFFRWKDSEESLSKSRDLEKFIDDVDDEGYSEYLDNPTIILEAKILFGIPSQEIKV